MRLETVVSWWSTAIVWVWIVRAHLMNLNDIKCNIYSHKAYTWLSQKSKISKYIHWWKGRDEASYFLCSFQSLEQKEQQRAKMRVHPGPTWSDQEQKFSGHRSHPPADALAALGAAHLQTLAVIDSQLVAEWLRITSVRVLACTEGFLWSV